MPPAPSVESIKEPPENYHLHLCWVYWYGETGEAEWVRDCFWEAVQFTNSGFVVRWGSGLGKINVAGSTDHSNTVSIDRAKSASALQILKNHSILIEFTADFEDDRDEGFIVSARAEMTTLAIERRIIPFQRRS